MSKASRLARRQGPPKLVADGRVFIGYIHGDNADPMFFNSLLSLIEWDYVHGKVIPGGKVQSRRVSGRINVHSGPRIATSRNLLVRQFLQTDGEWLWMVDTDMVFPHDILDHYFQVADPIDRPIVGGLCFAGGKSSTMTTTMYRIFVDDDGYPISARIENFPRDSLVKVDATGAACLLIHRSVLEAVGKTWDPKTAYPWFAESEFNRREFGEDVTFCMRARQAGFPIFIHTGIKVGHRKSYVLTLDDYDAQLARIEADGGTQGLDADFAKRLQIPTDAIKEMSA